MKQFKRTSNKTKILNGMDKVYEKLIEFKKRMNTELVVLKDNKITRVKP
jgi:ribosomal protein S21